MGNELTVNTLGDAVREKVRLAIFSSIPDEAVDKLIENEFKRMTESDRGYNGNDSRSPLESIVFNEIKKQVSERATTAVSEYLDQTFIAAPKEIVDKTIKELAPMFLAGLAEAFAGQAVNNLRNQLQTKGIYL